jgi:hypothetical protein
MSLALLRTGREGPSRRTGVTSMTPAVMIAAIR